MVADTKGHFGYQAVGGIPVRRVWERGYRPGWDPAHQWQGIIPFEQMPRLEDPDRGWVATANNRVAPENFPYPLSGTWASGHRARRIRQMIESRDSFSRETFAEMQQDTRTLRADEALPGLLPILQRSGNPRVLEAATLLHAWDRNMAPDSAAALIFEVFFNKWCGLVAAEKFDRELADALIRHLRWAGRGTVTRGFRRLVQWHGSRNGHSRRAISCSGRDREPVGARHVRMGMGETAQKFNCATSCRVGATWAPCSIAAACRWAATV